MRTTKRTLRGSLWFKIEEDLEKMLEEWPLNV